MITITSRYVLFNNSSEPLQYGQRNTSLVWQLAPGVKAPFHWDDADGRFELCVRPAQGKWNWSGAFEVSPALPHPALPYLAQPLMVLARSQVHVVWQHVLIMHSISSSHQVTSLAVLSQLSSSVY